MPLTLGTLGRGRRSASPSYPSDRDLEDPYARQGGGADEQYRGTDDRLRRRPAHAARTDLAPITADAGRVVLGDEGVAMRPASAGEGVDRRSMASGAGDRPMTFDQMRSAGFARPRRPTPVVGGLGPSGVDPIVEHIGPDGTNPDVPVPGEGIDDEDANDPNDILRLLLEGINAPGAFDTDALRDQFEYLSGDIDDDFTMANRDLDESMARRGLYGSTGADFHSGRAADLNVGRRTARTALARDLAHQAAQSGAQDRRDRLAWLSALMGFGQQAFENDLTTALFDRNTAQDEQSLLEQLLGFGYGGD